MGLTIILLLSTSTMISAIEHDEDINIVLPAEIISHSPINVPEENYLGIFNNCGCHEAPEVLMFCCGEACSEVPIIPVTTPLFKLKLTSIATIHREDFRELKNLEALEIEGNDLLGTIEPGCFKEMSRLRNLTIFNNFMLNCLEENVFEGLVNLQTLCLSKNGFNRVVDATRGLSPKYVPRLMLLDLSQNIFDTVEEHDFHYMNGTQLHRLNLNLCGIIYIHPNCLGLFKNLTYLRLGQNLFNTTTITRLVVQIVEDEIPLYLLNLLASGFRKILPEELLGAVGRSFIVDIVLARNHFDELEDDSFPEMPNLRTMDLRECYISQISNDAFKKITNLTHILLNSNRLNTVPIGVLKPTLKLLDVAANSNEEFLIPDRLFENLTLLEILSLSYNNIQYISNQTFVGLKSLLRLNLKKTQLTYIENGAFIHTSKLQQLNLMSNPLLTMTAETFRGLSSVKNLLLGSCALKNLTSTPGVFQHFRNISFLALDNNEIRTITSNQLTHLQLLKIIHLENNKLIPWTKRIFPNNLFEKVIAYQNKFTYITTAMLEDFKSAKYLSLDGNPFRCDCSLYPAVRWFKTNTMAVDYRDPKNFIAKCDRPDAWRKISIFKYLNYLSDNSNDCDNIFSYKSMIYLAIFLIILLIIILLLYLHRWYIRYLIFLIRLSFMRHNFWTVPKKLDEISSYEYDAFISYSTKDRQWITKLSEHLEPSLKLCIFERDFSLGTPISNAVLQAIVSSRRIILVVSDAFAKSQWCQWETQLAEFHHLFFREDSKAGPDDALILIRLQEVKHATPILRYLMKTRIYLDWPRDTERQKEFWNKLKVTLRTPKGQIGKAN